MSRVLLDIAEPVRLRLELPEGVTSGAGLEAALVGLLREALAADRARSGEPASEPPPRPSSTSAERSRRWRERRAERLAGAPVDTGERVANVSRDTDRACRDMLRERVAERVANVSPVALAPASRSGSPSDLTGESLSFEESESARAGAGATRESVSESVSRHATATRTERVANVSRDTDPIDLDAPPPPWALERMDTLRMSLGDRGVDARAEWLAFLAHSAKARAERRPGQVNAASWQSWLTKAWTFARRDAERGSSRRIVQRDPAGPKAYVVDDGSGEFLPEVAR